MRQDASAFDLPHKNSSRLFVYRRKIRVSIQKQELLRIYKLFKFGQLLQEKRFDSLENLW